MEYLMAACIEVHTAVEKKHRKGKKTHTVDFIEIDLLYPDYTEVENHSINLKKRLKTNENLKPTAKGGRDRNGHPNHGGNLQQRPTDLFQASKC